MRYGFNSCEADHELFFDLGMLTILDMRITEEDLY